VLLQRLSRFFERLFDQVDAAGGGADVGLDDAVGGGGDGLAAVGVFQKFLHGAAQGVAVGDLDAGTCGDELAGDGAEVLHVGPEDDGMTAGGGFDDVLAALPHEALADKDDRRDLVKPFQFARGVDDEAIVGFGGLLEVRVDLGAEHEFDLFAAGKVRDLARAFDVARDEDEEQARESYLQIREDIEEDFLLAGVGAPRDQDWLRRRDANLLEQLDGIDVLHIGMGHGDIVLHVARHVDAAAGHAESCEVVGILRALRADQGEVVENLGGKSAQTFVAPLGTEGHAAVHEKQGHAAARGHPDVVGPQLGFHEDDEVGPDQVVGAADGPGEILRKVEQLDFLRQAFVSERVARRSRGGHDDAQVGKLALQRANEQERDVYFAHAHRLDPAARFFPGSESFTQVCGIKTEALPEVLPVLAALPHFVEEQGAQQHKAQRVQYCVQKPNHGGTIAKSSHGCERDIPTKFRFNLQKLSQRTKWHCFKRIGGAKKHTELAEITQFPVWHTSCAINRLMNRASTHTLEPVGAENGRTEAHFRSLIENTTDIITILEADGNIRYESPSIERILGYKPEELIGRNVFELIHPDDVARIQKIFTEGLIRAGRIESGEYRFRHKDGSWRVFEGIGKSLLEDPTVRGVIVNSRDITERKRMDNALHKVQQQQRALLDNIPDLAWVKDTQSRYIAANEAFAEALGCTPEEMVGKTDFDFVPRDLAEHYTADDKQVMELRQRKYIEEPFVDAAGNRIWVETIKSAVLNDQGEVAGTTGVARDITKRKQMDQALRTSEERYRTLFETMREGFALCEIIWDADGKPCDYRYLDVNPAFEKILGVTRSQTIGKTVREIFPQVEEYWIDIYGKVALTSQPTRFEHYLRAVDKHFEVAAFSPKRGQFAAIFSDVTGRKQNEERLRLQSTALEAAAIGIALTDSKGTILWVNPAFTKLTGYTVAEAIGQNMRLLKSGKHDEGFYRNLWETVNSGKVWQGDIINRRKDGSLYDEGMTITPVRDERGESTYFIAMKQDITDRKQAETSLRESEELFRSLSVSSPLGIFLTDIQGRLTYANPRCRELYGFTLMESQNDGWTQFIHVDDREWVTRQWQVFITDGIDYSCEYRVCHRNGNVLCVHVRAGRMQSERGESTGFVGTIEDVTLRKRSEDDLRESKQKLEHALEELQEAQQQVIQQERLRALGTMASGIAHDFNNALAAILGFTELLIYRPETLADKEKTLRFLQMMNTAAKDAGNVVNRLREFYRQREEGEVFVPVDLNRLAEDAVSLTQPKWKNQAEANGIAIHVATELGNIPTVDGNAADLREALTNLIFNAVDAMPQGGTITLRTRLNNSRVILEVIDTGTGMTDEVRTRCLEPFFTTKGDRGTGLGLSMVYGILQRHQGTVDIQSKLGNGTTFILSLPIAVKPQPPKETDSAPCVLRPLRVLLVDDEDLVRRILKEFLLGDKHIVETAAHGKEALDKFQRAEFDVVILDRAMPDMSGDQVALSIKQLKPETPIILLTGFGSMMQAAGEQPPGVDLVVSKPVTILGLREAVAKVVAKYSPATPAALNA
jgi:nitrogen fixation negative regulator NifL